MTSETSRTSQSGADSEPTIRPRDERKVIEPLLSELSAAGRHTQYLPPLDVPEAAPPSRVRGEIGLPALSEMDVVRHFTRLSQLNYGIDTGIYPLGSCTMKYNPRVNEAVARLPGFAHIHPFQHPATAQGALGLLWELQQALAAIAGLAEVSVQPAAGAHGELTGVLMIWAYHRAHSDPDRDTIVVPETAHGTNPATASMAGYKVLAVPGDSNGNVDLEALRAAVGPTTAGLMITNPNTMGLFECHIVEMAEIVHGAGGLVYMDGANMNALLGIARPGDFGVDILHYNLHKTFSTPHGGGGPGAGAVAAAEALAPYLPIPVVERSDDGRFTLQYDRPESIGPMHAFYGNFANAVRGYAYIRGHGHDGLRTVSEAAVLNANYLRVRLKEVYSAAYDRVCMHETIVTGKRQAKLGLRTFDIVKRLMDYGLHPPTVYFPLTVPEAMLIEPTETESLASLDDFANALLAIAAEVEAEPDLVHQAPHTTPVGRLDEATAARKPKLTWDMAD